MPQGVGYGRNKVNKGRLLKRIAKTTGTTTGEARGIMKNVRGSVKAGNSKMARKTLSKALSGGPRAGVPRTPARVAKARKTSKRVVGRIETRQAGASPPHPIPGKPKTGDTILPVPRVTGRRNAATRGKGKKKGLKKQGY